MLLHLNLLIHMDSVEMTFLTGRRLIMKSGTMAKKKTQFIVSQAKGGDVHISFYKREAGRLYFTAAELIKEPIGYRTGASKSKKR
jgi:hypothetical protein